MTGRSIYGGVVMGDRLNPIEREVCEALNGLEGQWRQIDIRDPNCTRALNRTLERIGKRLGFEVYMRRRKPQYYTEWLYDMTWLRADGKWMIDFPMAMESQWSPGEVLDDFQKLVVSRARHRVMIMWQQSVKLAEELISSLLEQVRRCKLVERGDRFLLVCWVEDQERFEVRLHVVR
jgi:hypothetical protein